MDSSPPPSRLSNDSGFRPPSEFDGFSLRGPLGRGGMGHVYLAHELALDRPVAIKFVTAAAPGRAAHERFLIEARAIARLQHPNVVAIYRIGEVAGRPYLAYEYVAGSSLDFIDKPIAWPRALEIAVSIARGLSAAHSRGVVHRDIKPANVMHAADGTVKLLDFGLARLDESQSDAGRDSVPAESMRRARSEEITMDASSELPWAADHPDVLASARTAHDLRSARVPWLEGPAKTVTGAVLGTPLFLAPELWSGATATTRSDVYSLGVLLYELCTGSLPFAHHSGDDLVRAVREVGLPPIVERCSDLPRALGAIVDRAVQRTPDARYESAREMQEALEAVQSVYQEFRRLDAGTTEDDASFVSSSFGRVRPHLDALVDAVYVDMFRVQPGLRALFPADLTEQRAKLATTVRLAVDGLRNPERLIPILEELGYRHVGYGVSPKQFDLFGEALLAGIERFDREGWDERTAAAWRRAYRALADGMIQGMLPRARSA